MLGQPDRGVEAAQFVDQAQLTRLLARPYPALRDLVDLLWRQVPGSGRALDELVVDRLHGLGDLLALCRGKPAIRRIHLRLLAAAHRLDVRAQLLEAAGRDELAGIDANRSGERARLGDDGVAGQGNVVATRRGQVRHRDNQRTRVLARDRQLSPNHVGGRGRPARTVDPEHDGANRAVGPCFADVLHQRVSTDDGAVERIEAARPGVDHADGVDDGDL